MKAERLRLALATGGILLALALAVIPLRFQNLGELPPGLDAGEGANGVDALRVLEGEHMAYFPEKFGGREGLAMYAIAMSISFFGRNEFALRLPTALASAGTVFVVFWLGRVLFGRYEESGRVASWRGLTIGGVAAGLTAVSLSQTIMGRTAFRTSWLTLFLCLFLIFFWKCWSRRERGGRSWGLLVPAGVCLGLLPYTYTPARFVPFLLFFLGLSFLLPLRPVTVDIEGEASRLTGVAAAFHRIRAEMPKIVAIAGVAGLVAAPILVHFALHPEHFVARSNMVSLFNPARNQGDPLGTLLVNLWDHLLAFGFLGDPTWRHTFASRPMLNPAEAILFWLGVGIAVWGWQRRPAFRLLLLWVFILIIPAILAKDAAPNTLRMIGATPAVYLLIGVGMWEAFRFLKERFFEAKGVEVSLAMGGAVGALVIVQGVINYRTFFHKWAPAPETYEAYQTHWTELARTLDAQPSAANTLYLIPGYSWHSGYAWQYSFGYLYQGTTPTQMVSVGAFNLAPAVESKLAAAKYISNVKFIDWRNDIVGGDARADEQIVFLLGKYGRFQDSEEGPSFQIRHYTDISLDLPWTTYDRLEPLEVHYDGGISLRGLALGQGTEQLSSQGPFTLGQDGQAIWLAMQWESAPGLEIEYSISLRLHDTEERVVFQQDAVLRDSNYASTKNWRAEKSVDTLHYLSVPADLAPGEYELRLVVYELETLKPTVEIGVWEPVYVLARPRFEDFQ